MYTSQTLMEGDYFPELLDFESSTQEVDSAATK